MSLHKDLLMRVTAKLESAAEDAAAAAAAGDSGMLSDVAEGDVDLPSYATFPTATAEDRALLVAFALHCADLCVPAAVTHMLGTGGDARAFVSHAHAR
jgi:hypothetical protein